MGNDGAKIAAAMAAGYLIGRTRKAGLAFALVGGVLMAGRSLSRLDLGESRLGAVLVEVLGDVQRGAGEALASRTERFSESLRSQTENLGGGLTQDEDEESGDEEGEEEEDEEASTSRGRGAESNGRGEDDESSQSSSRRPQRARAGGGTRSRERQPAGRSRR